MNDLFKRWCLLATTMTKKKDMPRLRCLQPPFIISETRNWGVALEAAHLGRLTLVAWNGQKSEKNDPRTLLWKEFPILLVKGCMFQNKNPAAFFLPEFPGLTPSRQQVLVLWRWWWSSWHVCIVLFSNDSNVWRYMIYRYSTPENWKLEVFLRLLLPTAAGLPLPFAVFSPSTWHWDKAQ